jgi:hypothetical protein
MREGEEKQYLNLLKKKRNLLSVVKKGTSVPAK